MSPGWCVCIVPAKRGKAVVANVVPSNDVVLAYSLAITPEGGVTACRTHQSLDSGLIRGFGA